MTLLRYSPDVSDSGYSGRPELLRRGEETQEVKPEEGRRFFGLKKGRGT